MLIILAAVITVVAICVLFGLVLHERGKRLDAEVEARWLKKRLRVRNEYVAVIEQRNADLLADVREKNAILDQNITEAGRVISIVLGRLREYGGQDAVDRIEQEIHAESVEN